MGAASHDLRTPLASIKTAVSSLRQVDAQLSPEDRAELLELIELQSDRLARLVTNLLDMTRIEAGALELRPTTVGFDELVDEALGSARWHRRAGPRRGRGAGGPAAAAHRPRADEPGPGQRARERGAPLARRQRHPRDARRRRAGTRRRSVEIAVTDDGPGIAREDRESVFEMFSQNGGGGRAGLGLAIAKAFVEAHGGLIWIDPDVGHGARDRLHRPGGDPRARRRSEGPP